MRVFRASPILCFACTRSVKENTPLQRDTQTESEEKRPKSPTKVPRGPKGGGLAGQVLLACALSDAWSSTSLMRLSSDCVSSEVHLILFRSSARNAGSKVPPEICWDAGATTRLPRMRNTLEGYLLQRAESAAESAQLLRQQVSRSLTKSLFSITMASRKRSVPGPSRRKCSATSATCNYMQL